MYIYLNIDDVVIDIVEDIKPVLKNPNGITIPCFVDKAQGFMGTNEKIYARMGFNFIPRFDDIKTWAYFEENGIPDYVEPYKWKYINGEFVENTDPYAMDDISLTSATNQNTADIDYIKIMEDL